MFSAHFRISGLAVAASTFCGEHRGLPRHEPRIPTETSRLSRECAVARIWPRLGPRLLPYSQRRTHTLLPQPVYIHGRQLKMDRRKDMRWPTLAALDTAQEMRSEERRVGKECRSR